MFKRLYEAGRSAAENKLQRFIWSKTMSPDEKKEATGMLGVAVGQMLENVALGGMAIAALAAVAFAMGPGGLSVAAFLALGATGTALAGIGTFGKGMRDKGDEIAGGFFSLARGMHKALLKEVWKDLRGAKKQPAAFAPEAKPAAEDFSAAVAGNTAKPENTAPISAPRPQTLEIK